MGELVHRRKEAETINGRYINCRHYSGPRQATEQETFHCTRKGERVTCVGCNVCPKCGGLMVCEGGTKTLGMNKISVSREMKCLECGLYTSENVQIAKESTPKRTTTMVNVMIGGQQPPPVCAVKGCRARTWDKRTVKIDGIALPVCDLHYRQMSTWRAHNKKGDDQVPLILVFGELMENPNYKRPTKRTTSEREKSSKRRSTAQNVEKG